jgi:hypothetical protein
LSNLAIVNDDEEELGGKRVQDLKDLPRKSSFLLYGPPGFGKTFLACSADDVPDLRKVLLIDYEGGTGGVIANFPNVKHVAIEKYTDLQPIFDDLYENGKVVRYSTIILDNLTEICQAGLEKAAYEAHHKGDKDSYAEDHVTQRAYGTNLIRIRNLIRAFRALPVTTIWTAWEMKDRKPSGKEVIVPSFPGQLRTLVPGMVENVGRLSLVADDDGNEVRYMRFKETTTVEAKRRSNGLPETMDWPTMKKIWNCVLNSDPVTVQE